MRELLIAGPYKTPRCRPGRPLDCLLRGEQVVAGLTDAPIPWPYYLSPGGKRSLFLTGDLVRAVAVESSAAISHHWGISRWPVTRWRQQLGVSRWNLGTRELWKRLWPRRLGPEGSRKGGLATRKVFASK